MSPTEKWENKTLPYDGTELSVTARKYSGLNHIKQYGLSANLYEGKLFGNLPLLRQTLVGNFRNTIASCSGRVLPLLSFQEEYEYGT